MQKNATITPEELLKPRYKVIATWPGMHVEPFRLGQVITLQPYEDEDYKGFIHIPIKHIPGSFMREGFFSGYPHLFKKLEWWEERPIDEMPEYVKSIMQEYSYGVKVGTMVKVKEWVKICDAMYVIQSRNREYHASCFTPATAAEYEQYINKKQNDDTPTH